MNKVDEIIKIITEQVPGISELNHDDIKEQIESDRHRISTSAVLDGNRVVVRYYYKKNEDWKYYFHNELQSLQSLENIGLNQQPKVLFQNEEIGFAVESYLEGEPAGRFHGFSKRFIESVQPATVYQILMKMKKVKPELKNPKKSQAEFYPWILKFVSDNWPFDSVEVLNYWRNLYENQVKNEIELNSCFSHNDINPGNIIYLPECDDHIVGIIDWESSKYDGYFRDFASVYYHSQNFSSWSEDFFKLLNLESSQKKSFNFYYLYYLLSDLVFVSKAIKEGKNKVFRSGEMTKEQMESIVKENYLFAQKVSQS